MDQPNSSDPMPNAPEAADPADGPEPTPSAPDAADPPDGLVPATAHAAPAPTPDVPGHALSAIVARLSQHPLYLRFNEPAYLFMLFWCIYALSGSLRPTHYVAHVFLANAMLHGHFFIDDLPGFMEHTVFQGHTYVAYGIAPSLLMLPFVAIFGMAFHQPMFCAALGALCVVLWWELLAKLDVEPAWRTWLTALYGLGSLFWFYAGQNGNTWSIMHVVVSLGLLIAFHDVLGKQRGWIAGLGFGLAILSRQTVFLALPFFVGMMWRDDRATGGYSIARKALSFGVALAIPLAFNAFYNWARFGSPLDNGYAKVISEYQKLEYGFFHLHYLWTNVQVYFLATPPRLQRFPWFDPTMGGFSMFISTPALAFALFANYRDRLNVFALIALLPILAFYLVYHWTGYAQFGCRYALDFFPFAMLLVVSGVRNRWGTALTTAVAFGALVELWGLFWWGIKEW